MFTHAHPFNKEPDNKQYPFHGHTDAELVVLDLLGNIDMLAFWISLVIISLVAFGRYLPVLFPGIQRGPEMPVYLTRGPPVYTCNN